ncbi:hypothetical protein [Sorangium sp. So ce131]|uniref:hypothetical protein n=1 Tax=Sorangium sp. So ce131 TaxID=3133282 RepID=UPI003F628B35
MKPLISLILWGSGLVGASAADAARTFSPPVHDGRRIERCYASPRYSGADACGDDSAQEVADQFCRDRGLRRSTYWSATYSKRKVAAWALEELGACGILVHRWTDHEGRSLFARIDCE